MCTFLFQTTSDRGKEQRVSTHGKTFGGNMHYKDMDGQIRKFSLSFYPGPSNSLRIDAEDHTLSRFSLYVIGEIAEKLGVK